MELIVKYAKMPMHNSQHLLKCVFIFKYFETFLRYILAFNYGCAPKLHCQCWKL